MNTRLFCVRSTILIAIISIATTGSSQAQVRGKRPDRGTYQPPILESVALESVSGDSVDRSPHKRRETTTRRSRRLLEETLRQVDHQEIELADPESIATGSAEALPRPIRNRQGRLERRTEEDLHQPVAYHDTVILDGPILSGPGLGDVIDGGVLYESGCDSFGCDSDGCDAMGCGGSGWANAFVSLDPERWFGSVELLLMYRKGDHLPGLITTGPNEGQADTQVLFGNETLFEDITAGGRLTLGTYIDQACCRSLVLRGWFAGEESAGFMTDGASHPVLGRPFLNVSDGVTPFADVQIINSPGRADGRVKVDMSSNVFGADVSVRQRWWGGYGATVDLLYGYQFMQMKEDLRINNSTVSLDNDFAPLGSLIDVTDDIEASNEFHGAQFGFATHYREGCWTFNTLVKAGFGALQRKAVRTGNTTISSGGLSSSDPQGLLVRNTNSGTTTDSTFGWVPELDFSLGYHRFPRYDLTIGYHVIGMTDALQVSGAMDPNLASNLSDPAIGAQNPTRSLRFDTYYVHGIHFGLQHRY